MTSTTSELYTTVFVIGFIVVMAKEDLMLYLYKNRRNLTIEVLDYVCLTLHLFEIN